MNKANILIALLILVVSIESSVATQAKRDKKFSEMSYKVLIKKLMFEKIKKRDGFSKGQDRFLWSLSFDFQKKLKNNTLKSIEKANYDKAWISQSKKI
jgi:hypothetical protein